MINIILYERDTMEIEEINAKCQAQSLKSSRCLIEAHCLLLIIIIYYNSVYIIRDEGETYTFMNL